MTNESLHTTLEQSRQVQGVMERLGIEADGWHSVYCNSMTGKETEFHFTTDENSLIDEYPDSIVRAYRLDKLMLALPGWRRGLLTISATTPFSYIKDFLRGHVPEELMQKTYALTWEIALGSNPEAIEACVKLIALLEKEKLI